jgi:biotin carboxyl carrier protein
MMHRSLIFFLAGLCCVAALASCSNNGDQAESTVVAVVPVTVTTPRTGKMAEYTELMGTSAYLIKTVIKSPLSGYIEKCTASPGDKVLKNQVLFQLRSKEAVALQQDSLGSVGISGIVTMKASIDGVVAAIDHPQGDFVQEGDALGTLVAPGSLVFLLEVPFEMKSLVIIGRDCRLILPDNTEISAFVKSVLPSMSETSQTQRMVLQPRSATGFPENLMAKVKIARTIKNNAVILPKSCILNDEIMQNFWVMKLISDSIAVKIPVKTGIQGTDSIEVISPVFNATDRILNSGNYGLGDTVKVRMIKH